ncbi:hornerin [Drosophila biarmipes]|uniref:hornerin n=1 Tax=Drosophila biarmipes TaxID=125945 RepID=UPI0007E6B1E9|nr:hornerin [Drosophila biarmipes]
MKLAGVPLAGALLSCCFFLLAAGSSSSVPAAPSPVPASASAPAPAAAAAASSSKPKRDAGLSFGGIPSYHGPSHKYLPPAYENHLHFGSFHGSALGSAGSAGYSDYSSHLKGESSYGHHYGSHAGSHGYAASSGHGRPHHYSTGGSPKIETYIVQTSGSSSSGHNYHGQRHGIGHGISHGIGHGISHGPTHVSGSGLGYKYAAPSTGGYLSLLGNNHKTSTYVVAAPEYSSSSSHGEGSHGVGFGSGPVHRPSYSGHLPSHGYGGGFGHAISHQISHESASHGPSHSLDHSLEHALEHGLGHALGLSGHSSGGQFAQHPLPQPAEEHTGYSYDAPASPFAKGVPLSSYGVPLIPGYDHQESLQEPVQVQVLEQEQKADREQERETPVYALGHKGLGHFTYTASKPQALHTDVLSSGHSGASGHDLDLSKTPFKPSAFLGAKHESVSNSISGYDYATPSSPFLQASSSPGYDYPAPAQLYGPPGHSGDSATPIFEPEATYLPPASSYGPPATSSHGYH